MELQKQEQEQENKTIYYEFMNIGFMPNPEIMVKKSHQEIINTIKEENINKTISKIIKKVGLTPHTISIFEPYTYNYSIDTLDISIKKYPIDKKTFSKYIKKHQELINHNLSKNKSYDGYTATTTSDTTQELQDIKKPNYEPDIIVFSTIINEEYKQETNQYLTDTLQEIIQDNIITYSEPETEPKEYEQEEEQETYLYNEGKQEQEKKTTIKL